MIDVDNYCQKYKDRVLSYGKVVEKIYDEKSREEFFRHIIKTLSSDFTVEKQDRKNYSVEIKFSNGIIGHVHDEDDFEDRGVYINYDNKNQIGFKLEPAHEYYCLMINNLFGFEIVQHVNVIKDFFKRYDKKRNLRG